MDHAAMTGTEVAAELVKTVGFPIFVACWFMLRTDKRLDTIIELLGGKRK